MTKQEILNEIRRITDIRNKSMHEYRRLRSQSERELYRVLLADSQLINLQTQLILNKKEIRN
jgi:hypothetical protein